MEDILGMVHVELLFAHLKLILSLSIVHSTQTLNNKTTNMDNAGDAVQKVKGAGHDAAQAMDRNDARVQRKINPRWARAFGRIGYITRGVIYIIIGVSLSKTNFIQPN
jgi:hypothetical protein